MKVELQWVTQNAETQIMRCARQSSSTPLSDDVALLRYCVEHKHWSVFEMANMCVQIETSRAISAQIIRHRSFSYQEFSQRYAVVQGIEPVTPRRQAEKNRQSSTPGLSPAVHKWFAQEVALLNERTLRLYEEALQRGVARESARFVLPMASYTRLAMNGTARSWIHYLQVRDHPDTQEEHRAIARQIKAIFVREFPHTSAALGWAK